jgi:mRNA interferase MazF
VKRGDVYRVRLDHTEGREIRKTRPAVVVSNDAACTHHSVIQVVPITRLRDRELRPYECLVSSESSGLTQASRAVANQIRTVAKHRASERIGRLTGGELAHLDRAVAIQLGLPFID